MLPFNLIAYTLRYSQVSTFKWHYSDMVLFTNIINVNILLLRKIINMEMFTMTQWSEVY